MVKIMAASARQLRLVPHASYPPHAEPAPGFKMRELRPIKPTFSSFCKLIGTSDTRPKSRDLDGYVARNYRRRSTIGNFVAASLLSVLLTSTPESTRAAPEVARSPSPSAPSSDEQLRRPLDPDLILGIESTVIELLGTQKESGSEPSPIPPGSTVREWFQRSLSRKASETYPEYYLKDDLFDDPFPRPQDYNDLSSVDTFAFRSYVLWQLASEVLHGEKERVQFQKEVGRRLLKEQFPDVYTKAGRKSSVRESLETLLRDLYERGYIVSWQLQNVDLPLDTDDESELEDFPFQARVLVQRPADIQIVERLRASDGGFWGRQIPSLLVGVGEKCGFKTDADEFILMNKWEGPKTLQGKILKSIGDPLFQVGVPFKPDSLVIDLQFRS